MERDKPRAEISRLTELRERLGMLAGKRPEWIDEEIWDTRSPAELAMIKRMHYKGKAGFTILRSAETGVKNYHRAQNE